MRFVCLSVLCISALSLVSLYASECSSCRSEPVSCAQCSDGSPGSMCCKVGSYPLDQSISAIGPDDIIGYDILNSTIRYPKVDISAVPEGNTALQFASYPEPYTSTGMQAVYVPGTNYTEDFVSNVCQSAPENTTIYNQAGVRKNDSRFYLDPRGQSRGMQPGPQRGADQGLPAYEVSGVGSTPDESTVNCAR